MTRELRALRDTQSLTKRLLKKGANPIRRRVSIQASVEGDGESATGI